MPAPRKWRRVALELLVIAALVLAFRAYQRRGSATGEAPTFEALRVDGAPAALADYQGQPIIMHFWASWCGVCRAMEGTVAREAIGGLPILRIASRSGARREVRAYLESRGERVGDASTENVLLDPDGAIAARYGVRAFPTTYWIDGEGRIRHVEVGYTTSAGMRARAFFTRIGL